MLEPKWLRIFCFFFFFFLFVVFFFFFFCLFLLVSVGVLRPTSRASKVPLGLPAREGQLKSARKRGEREKGKKATVPPGTAGGEGPGKPPTRQEQDRLQQRTHAAPEGASRSPHAPSECTEDGLYFMWFGCFPVFGKSQWPDRPCVLLRRECERA